ncbi:PIG-L deacetylase family protein [Streptomyces sp. NBC_01477]|uniref:PIG-L deacetylase family protein n=1 Tax=Streptomyces sp. NBC_01477 TaxID=2976015 RepID=UPI002E36F219|nr:PIG-L family deacetylase [Streptomyces sp. NBC_01477]
MTEQQGRSGPAHANPIQAPGTDERLWQAWDGWEGLPECRLPRTGRVVVVAAHPDDEVLAAGGTIALLAGAGVGLTLVSVTDGERSHPHSTVHTPREMAGIRAAEVKDALAELGASAAEVVRLHVPDTETPFHEDEIAKKLAGPLSGAALCLTPWIGDVHGDHEAVGRATLAAARTADVPVLMYPVWMWHWARPDDPALPWTSAQRVTLTPDAVARKRAAVERFASQIRPLGPGPGDAPVLPPDEIAHHLRHVEVVFG